MACGDIISEIAGSVLMIHSHNCGKCKVASIFISLFGILANVDSKVLVDWFGRCDGICHMKCMTRFDIILLLIITALQLV